MRRPWILGLAVLAAACGRDLELPRENTLVLSDPFPSAAPREALAIGASGGALPYAFSFAPGSPVSGPDATLDPSTGAYVAGSIGPAVDVVQVRDAGGAVREARISVGPPLQVAPRTAFVAPGGRVAFAGSGGKPPYQLEVASGVGSAQGTDYLAPPSGGCAGAVSTPTQAQLRLRDATSAAPIDLTVSIGRGLDLFPAAGTGDVAPYEQIAFVASGGQPPYEFSMEEPVPSGGPGIDAGRGTYVAGPVGNVVDRVVVTDANGEQRCFDVAVGPPLAVALSSADPRPGKPMRILASGGRPPYAFSFALKGNRSRGVLDPVSGAYTPGQNALATDLVVVRDATGAPPVGPIAVPVGPIQIASGPASAGCYAGDLDGDGAPEAISAALVLDQPQVAISAVTTSFPFGANPVLARYFLGPGFSEPAVGDLDGDGDADLAFVTGGSVLTLLGQPGGHLGAGPSAAVVAQGPIAVARGTRRIFASASGGCAGIVALEIDPASGAFLPPTCIATGSVVALAAGDFDGDGQPDVAYATTGVVDRVSFRFGGGATPYAVPRDVLLPAPWRVERLSSTVIHEMIEVRPSLGAPSDLVAIVIDAPRTAAFRTGLASFLGGPGGPVLGSAGRVQPGGALNVLGIAATGSGGAGPIRIAAWNGTDGTMLLLDYPFTASPPTPSAVQIPPRAYRVGCVTAADFDRDGFEDLFVAPRDGGPRAEKLHGEADGGYARRPRFATRAGSTTSGDVDGDGLADFVGASPEQGLEVLFTGGGQLAVGPEVPLDGQFLRARAADWDGDGIADLMARVGASGLWFLRGLAPGDGTFAAPQPVAVTDPSGAPVDLTSVYLATADLGGAAPGPDLLAIYRIGSQLHWAALVFSSATAATFGLAAPVGAWEAVADLDGDGIEDVASLGATTADPVAVALVKPGDPPGPSWPFRPWAFPGPSAIQGLGGVPVPGAVPPRGRAVLLDGDGIVIVEAPGGTPAAQKIPFAPGVVVAPEMGALGDVTGDGLPDVVLSQTAPNPWLVFPGTIDGLFETTPRADLAFGFPQSFSFGLIPGVSGAHDLVIDLPGGVAILENDGLGRFR